jgi:hypothetical protein
MNSSNDLQQVPSLPVDFESVTEKLQASCKRRKEERNSHRNQRYNKKRKDKSRKNKSLHDNDEPPQPDHISRVDISQNIWSGEVVMANKELELKSVDGRGGGIVNDPHQYVIHSMAMGYTWYNIIILGLCYARSTTVYCNQWPPVRPTSLLYIYTQYGN